LTRNFYLATRQCATNCRRTDRLVDAVRAWHESNWLNGEVVYLAELAQRLHVATAAVPKVKIFADHDDLGL
jgi:hypothetical protein